MRESVSIVSRSAGSFIGKPVGLCLFLILAGNIGISGTEHQYIIFGILMLTVLAYLGVNGTLKREALNWHDAVAGIYVGSWLYGFLVGVVNENPTLSIIRNFAGMAVYSTYYLLTQIQFEKKRLIRVLFYSAICNIGFALLFGDWQSPADIFESTWDSAPEIVFGRKYYSIGVVVVFVLMGTIGIFYLTPKEIARKEFLLFGWSIHRRVARFILFIVSIHVAVVMPGSKGFLLAFLFLVLSGPIAHFGKQILAARFGERLYLWLGFLALVGILGYVENYHSVIWRVFSGDESGNAIRYTQSEFIIEELTWSGRGLGAPLMSGYERDELGYGFEVTYLNVLHKLGIVGCFVLFGYIYTLYRILMLLFNQRNLMNASVSLGAMSYLWPSMGNPLLFSPVASLLHCAALYLTRPEHRIPFPERKPTTKMSTAIASREK